MESILLKPSAPLPPTEKLFLDDFQRTECEATVLYIQDDLVVLDRTVCYAESGGQVADTAWIDEVEVIDCQKYGGNLIFIKRPDVDVPPVKVQTILIHRLAVPAPFQIGQTVHVRVNPRIRYLNSRNHSAAHFLWHAFRQTHEKATGEMPFTKGCHINATSFRFDFFPKFDVALLPAVEDMANEMIALGGEILMKPDDTTKEVCIWEYEGLNGRVLIPCGGTHVHQATALNPMNIKRRSMGKNLDRISGVLTDTPE